MRASLLLLFLVAYLSGQVQTQNTHATNKNAPGKQSPSKSAPAPPVEPKTSGLTGASPEPQKGEKVDSDSIIATYTQKLANYTLVLAIFTGVLTFVGVLQFVALMRQAGALRHHSELIGRSVEQMRLAVTAYERYVGVGEQGLVLTRESNETTRDATGLTRQSLLLTHRPKLIVRGFYTIGGVAAFQDGRTVSGHFDIVNVGGTEAEVRKLYGVAVVAVQLPMRIPYESLPAIVTDRSLAPGERMSGDFTTVDGALHEEQIARILTVPQVMIDHPYLALERFFVYGFVDYSDGLEQPTLRRTGFCRVFNSRSGRFHPIEDPDYEHAD